MRPPFPQKTRPSQLCHLTLFCLPPVHHVRTSCFPGLPEPTSQDGHSPRCAPEQVERRLPLFIQTSRGKGRHPPRDTPAPPSAWPPVPSFPAPQTCGHLEPWGLTFAPTRFQGPAPLAPPPRRRAGWNHGRLADLPAGPGQSADGCDPKGNVSLTLVTFSPAPGALCLVGFPGGLPQPGPWG